MKIPLILLLFLFSCSNKLQPKKSAMSVELNEFTEDQLQFAIDMFIDKTDDINRSLQRLEDSV
jgi:hypothetical protein